MANSLIYSQKFETPIGETTVFATLDGVCMLRFSDKMEMEAEKKRFSNLAGAKFIDKSSDLTALCAEMIKEYFRGNRKVFDIPLDLYGSEFQKRAWGFLQKIPYAQTISYKEQALEMGDIRAIRAIAGANAKNPVSIIVPCHRVIGANGSAVGYSGGVWRKIKLIELESANSTNYEKLSLF